MDTVQAVTHPTIDSEGFVDGSLAASALNEFNAVRVVTEPLPEGPLAELERWRWVEGAWSGQLDYRGTTFYDPADTDREHHPAYSTDAPPVGWLRWLDGENKLVGPDESLAKARNAKWASLREQRDTLESTSFPYLGQRIQSDIKSVLRIGVAVKAADYALAMGAPFATEWRCLDDTLLPLDGPAMQFMPVALAAYAQGLHSHANALREQVYSAPDEAALALIDW
jgi:hypothetical protein